LAIYQTIVKEGWTTANERFARELTLAVQWTDNPLAWTYATLHTQPIGASVPPCVSTGKTASAWIVAVIEADDGIRRALADCLNAHSEFSNTSGFDSVNDALPALRARAADLVLMNHALTNGATMKFIASSNPPVFKLPTLVYSVYEDSDQLFKATPGGASSYLLKRTTPDKLLDPIAGPSGEKHFSSELIAFRVRQYFRKVIDSLPVGDASPDLAKLTQREQEILNLLSKGYVDKEIAEALRISIWTVHGHMKNIFEKLGVHTRTEAVVKYLHK
jgi:DNA-binding NarL/FixJ family response regulator